MIEAILEQVHRGPDDVLVLAGSLCEELGNHRSDVDIYRISADRFALQGGDPVEILDLGSFAADVETICGADLDELLARLGAVDSDGERDPRQAVADFSDAEVKLLHQLRIAQPITGTGAWQRLVGAIDRRKLGRVLLDRAVAWMGALHIDILGFIESGDDDSARPLLRAFRWRLAAALLAGLGETNPAEKWQTRQLAALRTVRAGTCLPGGLDLDRIYDAWLALDRRIGDSAAETAFRALLGLRFSIVPWAQHRFLAGYPLDSENNIFPEVRRDGAGGGSVLPALRLDSQIQRDARGIWLSRVASPEVIYINPLAHEVLLHFDGTATAGEAAQRLAQISPATSAEIATAIDDVHAMLGDRAFI
ncbi:hypothetical protein [Sphingomonas sp. ERG5]|uniref:hypothetical protein n=1 Tax=Sphingomonas sp. ERG5 TaxID=1381597 RepID=UPI001364A666|nr:hypothetical protein [Sphingomonas sp. ERG5]